MCDVVILIIYIVIVILCMLIWVLFFLVLGNRILVIIGYLYGLIVLFFMECVFGYVMEVDRGMGVI